MDRQTLIRSALGAVAIVVIAGLALQIAAKLLEPGDEGEAQLELVEAPAEPASGGVAIRANEPVRLRVEVDGEETLAATLCNGDPEPGCAYQVPAADEIAIELSDLTRATVSYNGRRIEPLGNLSAPRRLVFVDDSD